MLASQYDDPQEALPETSCAISRNAPGVQINGRVGESEVRTSSRNAAMAHFHEELR
jgi:glutaminase